MVYATTVPDFKKTLWKIFRLNKNENKFAKDETTTMTKMTSTMATGNKDKTSMLVDRFL